jgi:autotransporter adhesin
MNRIYRLVWCHSRKILVVASELASFCHGSSSSGAGKVDRRTPGSTSRLLLVALIGASGMLFASGVSAQSAGDAKLDDLQLLITKYDTSHASAAPTQVVASSGIAANNSSVSNEAPIATALPTAMKKHAAVVQSRIASAATREAHTAAATPALADIASTVASRTPVVFAKASVASQQQLQSAVATPSASPNSAQGSVFQAADTTDRKLTQVVGAQLAQQSSTTKTQDSPSDVQAIDVAAPVPAIKRPEQPVALTVAATDKVGLVEAIPPVSLSLAATAASTPPTTATSSTPVPKASIAASVVADAALKSSLSGPMASTSEVADRRLKHRTDANDTGQTKSTDVFDDTDTSEVAAANASPTGVSPLAFSPLSSVATATSLSSLEAPVSQAAPVTAAVPVFPTPSSLPTGLIVGNGGLVGAASQLLGTTTNSLFSSSNGYVSNGSLQVINSNFSQGYSVVSVLGIPLLTLNPVGTLLTSTTGALVGGTGENSHLTLLGGVTSNSYIYNINNGNPSGVLGLLLPNAAPAFASTCLNALVVQVACYGINAAQDYQVLVGDGATANGSKEVVIGTNASHTLPLVNADTAFPGNGVNDATDPTGVPTADYEARLGHSVVIGDSASGTANAQTILGAEATSDAVNSVALGYQSIANRGPLANYTAYGLTALQNSAGEVSIGSPGQERQITNVAPGSAATDAVNVAQLEGVVAADTSDSVQYDTATHTSVTLAGVTSTDGGVTNGTTLTNLHQGAVSSTSTDAVNGAQLWNWTLNPANQYSNTSLYNDINNSAGSKYYAVDSTLAASQATGTNAIAAGPTAVASGADALAVGDGANASFANSIALGAGSATVVGALVNYTAYGLSAPQTSAGELNVGNRQITGVAAGSAPDDAVNLAQLEAVSTAGGGGTSNRAVLYDADASGNPTNTITLTGNGSGAPVGITNVAAGAETATSTDAVNGSQLWNWTQNASNMYSNYSLYNDFNSLTTQGGGGNSKYVQVNSTLGGATAGGTNSVAIGPVASASGANSVAVGNGASATADNSVALGAGSLANRDNTVSVGTAGGERQITNVAAGTSDTDAANVGQVNTGVQQAENWASSYTDQRVGALSSEIQQVGNRANAGVAAAMAMAGLPQAYEPGKSMAAVAAGTFRSESSIAVGVSTISEGGRWVYKLTGSVDTRGDGGMSIGAGMQW